MRVHPQSDAIRARFQQAAAEKRRTLSRAVAGLRDRNPKVRLAALHTIAEHGARLHWSHLPPLLTDRAVAVRADALRLLSRHPVPSAFGPAWRLFLERRHFDLDRHSQQLALRIALHADPDLAIRVFAATLSRHAWLGPLRPGFAGLRRLIVEVLASATEPAVREAVRQHADCGKRAVRSLCRRAERRFTPLRRQRAAVQPVARCA